MLLSREKSYELISHGLGGVIAEVNRVIEKGSVLVGEQDVKLEFYLGSDYKVQCTVWYVFFAS